MFVARKTFPSAARCAVMVEDERFLSRWAKRKSAAVEKPATSPDLASAAAGPPPMPTSETTDADEAESVEALDLPDIENLTAESDFTVFMKEGVPDELRNLALRRMWRLVPIFGELDGMNDYDEDYSVVVKIAEGLSNYEIGKGYVDEDEEKEDGEVAENEAEPESSEASQSAEAESDADDERSGSDPDTEDDETDTKSS